MDERLINDIAGIVRSSAPLVLAAIGETFTERAGVVNLSLDGSLMLSALVGFVVALATGSVLIGTLAAALVGMLIALLIAVASFQLKASQVAVGFILTLLCRDLAIFLGEQYRSVRGLSRPNFEIPILRDIPIVGEILFRQDWFTYASFAALIIATIWIFGTRAGLQLRSIGDRPETAFARGVNVNRMRYFYTALGGALVGVGGAAFTLNTIGTWSEASISGNGWIALAITIFGGWIPLRVAAGVYLVATIRAAITGLQATASPQVLQLLNAMPWVLMLLTLFVVSSPISARFVERLPRLIRPPFQALLRARPPAALGATFDPGGK